MSKLATRTPVELELPTTTHRLVEASISERTKKGICRGLSSSRKLAQCSGASD